MLTKLIYEDPQGIDMIELEKFKRLVLAGEIYDHLLIRWKILDNTATRSDIKRITYKKKYLELDNLFS
jgi:hypothetical protein